MIIIYSVKTYNLYHRYVPYIMLELHVHSSSSTYIHLSIHDSTIQIDIIYKVNILRDIFREMSELRWN